MIDVNEARGILEDLVAGRPPRSPSPDDLAVLRQAARTHGLSGLAGKAMQEGSLALPADLAEGIFEDWRSAQRLSAVLDMELARIGEARMHWSGQLSPPIILKGPAVASRYSDPSVRGYVDIDLLVPFEELREWDALLRASGYEGPTRWQFRDAFYYGSSLAFRRPVGGRSILAELHYQMSTGSRVRPLTYEALAPLAIEAGAGQGILMAVPEAQVMIMSVHLAHHLVDGRRLIWLRDFVELGLGQSDVVAGARALAGELGQGRAVERALFAGEEVLGRSAWEARPEPTTGPGIEWANEVPRSGNLRILALMREMGPAEAARYLASRVDPRRFQTPGGRFEPRELQAWIWRQVRRARSTPWWRLLDRSDKR